MDGGRETGREGDREGIWVDRAWIDMIVEGGREVRWVDCGWIDGLWMDRWIVDG